MPPRLSPFVAALSFSLAACSGGLSREDFCDEYSKAYCETNTACCSEASSQENCEDGFGTFCALAVAQAKADDWDGEAAQDCVDEVRAAKDSCGEALNDDPGSACNRVLSDEDEEPLAQEGAACEFISDCEVGLYCNTSDVCAPQVAAGGSCAADSFSCADGTFCNASDVCEAGKPEGASCSSFSECASSDCQAGQCTRAEPGFCAIQFGS